MAGGEEDDDEAAGAARGGGATGVGIGTRTWKVIPGWMLPGTVVVNRLPCGSATMICWPGITDVPVIGRVTASV